MNNKTLLNIYPLLLLICFCCTSCIKEYDNPATGTTGELITIYALRQAYNGNEVTLNAGNLGGASKIQGVVISDMTGQNIEAGSFVIQQTIASANALTDITRGVVIKMNGSAAYAPGDSLAIDVTGARMGRINGKLTVSGISADKVTVLGSNKVALIRSVTQGMLHDLMEQYENTLVSINAEVADYAAGATLSGLKKLNDNTGAPVYLHTLPGAAFAGNSLPLSAQFTGIAGFYNETGNDTTASKKTIMPRTAADIAFAAKAMYPNFPESFEAPEASVKSSYNSGTNIVALGTGNWYLLQAILGNTPVSDKFNAPGKQAIRMQQNLTTSGYVQMNFDVAEGASKVTVFYGRYGTDAKSSFRLEYSINGGTTWVTTGSNITDMPDKGVKQAVWVVNLTGPVRFRINKLGTGTSNNGRLNLDDFTIYKN
jgi:hypothetical protein